MFNFNDIKIDCSDPFQKDTLDRKYQIPVLTGLLEKIDTPFTMIVNAEWGGGKTTFLRMWKCYLEQENYKTIYFNAWENDFFDDPFIAFISVLSNFINENIKDKDDEKRNDLEKLKEAIKKEAFPIIAKGILKKGLSTLLSETSAEKLVNISSEIAKKEFEIEVESYRNKRKNISEFKNTLKKTIELLTSENNSLKKPIIFFVDELDRCKPTYSIELLERVKHLLNIEGIIFIFAADLEQLANSINSVYGENFNAIGYLKRFYNYIYYLPVEINHDFVIQNANNSFVQQNLNNTLFQDFIYTITELASALKLPPRDIQHCIINTEIASAMPNIGYNFMPILTSTLIILRHMNLNLYNEFKKNTKDAVDILKFFNQKSQFLPFWVVLNLLGTSATLQNEERLTMIEKYVSPYDKFRPNEKELERIVSKYMFPQEMLNTIFLRIDAISINVPR